MSNKASPTDVNEALQLATDIVAAYVSNNAIKPELISELLQSTYSTVMSLNSGDMSLVRGNQEPAVPVSKSVTPDYIICLEDGKELKMLKRYLRTQYNMSPEDYRRKWNLPSDYPIVAPNYAKKRSSLAKKIGLGKIGGASGVKRPAKKKAAKKRGRKAA